MSRRARFRIIKNNRRSEPLRFWPEARRKTGWFRYSPLWLGAIFVGLVVGVGPGWFGSANSGASDEGGVRAHFRFCHVGGGYNCVVDGDTLYLKGVKIRIADIDAPETHEPKCAEEKSLGDRATQRLIELVNSGEVTLAPIDRDEDQYGRKLRIVKVDGESVGETLVEDGLARWYRGGRRPWC